MAYKKPGTVGQARPLSAGKLKHMLREAEHNGAPLPVTAQTAVRPSLGPKVTQPHEPLSDIQEAIKRYGLSKVTVSNRRIFGTTEKGRSVVLSPADGWDPKWAPIR